LHRCVLTKLNGRHRESCSCSAKRCSCSNDAAQRSGDLSDGIPGLHRCVLIKLNGRHRESCSCSAQRCSCSCSNDAAQRRGRFERWVSRFASLRFDQVERPPSGVVLVLSAAVLVLVLE
jgi:hypothetical protein